MMRTRLKPDRRSAFLLAAVLVGTVAGGGGLLYQQESQLADVVRQLHDKEKQRDESARIASRLADSELRYREDTDRLKFLESSLPSMAYVPTLLKQIEQLCQDTHNEVRSVRPDTTPAKPVRAAVRRTDPEAQAGDTAAKPEDKPKPPDPYDRLTIQVSLTGGYHEYQNFLQRLTQFPKIVAVDKVQLRPHGPDPKQGGPPQLDVDMQLTAFILKDGPAAADAAGAPAPGAVSAAATGATPAASDAVAASTAPPTARPPSSNQNRAVKPGTVES
jgi:Tfp pilus assembly protein PilO